MRSRNTIYLDYQASTPIDRKIFDEISKYLSSSYGNPHSLDHSIGWHASQEVESAASRVAGRLAVDADEIIFTSGATEANNLALLGLGRRATEGSRHRILLSAVEHSACWKRGESCAIDTGSRSN